MRARGIRGWVRCIRCKQNNKISRYNKGLGTSTHVIAVQRLVVVIGCGLDSGGDHFPKGEVIEEWDAGGATDTRSATLLDDFEVHEMILCWR